MAFVNNTRLEDLQRFYASLSTLQQKAGGPRTLESCSGQMAWPRRGVYFFYEHGEERSDSGNGLRVVRVGTHALKDRSKTVLWNRLSQHRGQSGSRSGNHRGSIFRLIIGQSLIARNGYEYPMWGVGNNASKDIRTSEIPLEREVSRVIGLMPFLWLAIDDEAGPTSLRGVIERNSIALLSNLGKEPLDGPSSSWLGHHCNRPRVRGSGLWNNNHVEHAYDATFLDVLEMLVNQTRCAP